MGGKQLLAINAISDSGYSHPLLSMTVEINGKIVNAIIDTASQVSIIQPRYSIFNGMVPRIEPRTMKSAFIGKPKNTTREVDVVFGVAGHKFLIVAAVMDMDYDMILGNDFCNNANIMTDNPDDLRLIKIVTYQGRLNRQKVIFPLEYYKPSVAMVQKSLRADTNNTQHPHVGNLNNNNNNNNTASKQSKIVKSDNNITTTDKILESKVKNVPEPSAEKERPKEKNKSTAIDKSKVDANSAAATNNGDTTQTNTDSVTQSDTVKPINKTVKDKNSKKSSSTDTKSDDDAAKDKFRLTRLAKNLKRDLDKEVTLDVKDIEQISKYMDQIMNVYKETIVDKLPKFQPPAREGFDMKIEFIDGKEPPPFHNKYPNKSKEEPLNKELDALLEADIIEEVDPKERPKHVSAAFLTVNNRLVIDYKPMNKFTKLYIYPVTNPDIIKMKIAGYKYYTVIDMKSGFHLLNIDKAFMKYTTFEANGKLYRFKRAPFGLKNSPGYFNHWVQELLRSFQEFVVAYVDDIIIFSNTLEEHNEHINKVLDLFQTNQIYVSRKKIQLFKTEVKYVGHMVSKEGIKPIHDKTKAIEEIPMPTTVREVRSLIGAATYYMKFIPNYAELSASLTDLTKGNPTPSKKVNLTEKHKSDVMAIKAALISADTLMAIDFSKRFYLYTDASDVGTGLMMTQRDKGGVERPVLYDSKKLDKHQKRYDTRDRELLAIVNSLDKFDWMLKDREVTIYTDHMNLVYLENSRDKVGRLERWSELINGFTFDVKYIKGETNYIPDMLSRNANFYLEWDQDFVTQVVESYETHKKKEWLQALLRRDDVVKDKDGLLYLVDKEKRLILVDDKQIETVLQEAHATTFGGHVGKNRLAARLRDLYYFKGFWMVIEKFIKACPVCQKCRIETVKQGFLNPLPIPDRPWKDLSTDYVNIPKSENGKDRLLVVVDRFSKMVRLWPCTTKVTAEETANWFLDNIICKTGAPQTIVSDQDPIFTSELWKKMMDNFGSKMSMTQPGRAQADGQTERTNRTIKEQIIKETTNRKKWCSKIHIIEASINSNINTSTGMSPFEIVYGYVPKFPINSHSNPIEDFKNTRETNWQTARDNLVDAQINQALHHDKDKHDTVEYKKGDLILVKRSRLNTAKFSIDTDLAKEKKLLPLYCGPFKVIEKSKRNDVNYKIQINNSRKGNRTVHVADTKLYIQDDTYFKPANKKVNPILSQEIEMIISHREREYGTINKSIHTTYLIRFEGLSEDHDWWIPQDYLTDYQELIDQYRNSELYKKSMEVINSKREKKLKEKEKEKKSSSKANSKSVSQPTSKSKSR